MHIIANMIPYMETMPTLNPRSAQKSIMVYKILEMRVKAKL